MAKSPTLNDRKHCYMVNWKPPSANDHLHFAIDNDIQLCCKIWDMTEILVKWMTLNEARIIDCCPTILFHVMYITLMNSCVRSTYHMLLLDFNDSKPIRKTHFAYGCLKQRVMALSSFRCSPVICKTERLFSHLFASIKGTLFRFKETIENTSVLYSLLITSSKFVFNIFHIYFNLIYIALLMPHSKSTNMHRGLQIKVYRSIYSVQLMAWYFTCLINQILDLGPTGFAVHSRGNIKRVWYLKYCTT